jgi:hypothetical protein
MTVDTWPDGAAIPDDVDGADGAGGDAPLLLLDGGIAFDAAGTGKGPNTVHGDTGGDGSGDGAAPASDGAPADAAQPADASSGDAGSAPVDPCHAVPSTDYGLYCGTSTQNSFDTSAANPNTLYDCEGGATASTRSCANGCYVAAAHEPDGCRASPTVDPCAGVHTTGNGIFCGTSTQYGFNTNAADTNDLYTCNGGVTVQATRCAQGCNVAAAGTPDSCR